ncbi:MAG: N-6 DNA methylase [Candidatus Hodarchaeales archaeon]
MPINSKKSAGTNLGEIESILNEFKSTYDFSNLPTSVHSQKEYLISIITGLWLLRFFNSPKPVNSDTKVFMGIEELKIKFPHSITLWRFLETIFTDLNRRNILEPLLLQKSLELKNVIINDFLGKILQQSLASGDRKRLAANYTNLDSAKLLNSFLDKEKFSSIIDPFCGSGRLISAYLETLDSSNQFPNITLNDIMPSAVLLAFCRIILILSKNNQDYNLLKASVGDAFSMISNNHNLQSQHFKQYDLILMNPPFTRTHRIDQKQKEKIKRLVLEYKGYLVGQPGLHVYALFLADKLSKENGILATVLPAATILSQYSHGVHKLLLDNWKVDVIASSNQTISFSENSHFREIMLLAHRRKNKKNRKIKFITIEESSQRTEWEISSIKKISEKKLKNEQNWTIFLKDPQLLEIQEILLKSGLIRTGTELKLNLVRGVEMYGPNFFYIPNRKWKIIAEENEEISLQSEKEIIRIPKEYIAKSLRKPSKYSKYISPLVSDYALSIPQSITNSQQWMNKYISVSEQFTAGAIKKFGSGWISHIYNQLKTKQPYGNLFIADKFGITSTSIMAHYSKSKISCSKNFYVLKNWSPDQAKLLAAWLNSTFFIILFLVNRREIGGSYGRLQIIDYMSQSLFLDLSRCSLKVKKLINREFDKIMKLKLPPIPNQLQMDERKALDLAIAQGLQFSLEKSRDLLQNMYMILETRFEVLQRLDKSRKS